MHKVEIFQAQIYRGREAMVSLHHKEDEKTLSPMTAIFKTKKEQNTILKSVEEKEEFIELYNGSKTRNLQYNIGRKTLKRVRFLQI